MTTTSPSNPQNTPRDPETPVGHTTGSIARRLNATLDGPDDLPIVGIAPLDDATGTDLTFIRNAGFASGWPGSNACAALVSSGIEVPGHDASTRALLHVENADVAMNTLLAMFAPPATPVPPGVHVRAIVDESATLGSGVHIGPNAVVGEDCVLEDGVVLHANVTLAPGVRIGRETVLHAGVVVTERCEIGSNCIVHPNVTIGADGFGYIPSPDGQGLLKVPHIGHVRIGHHVEIGASTCIDRGKFGATTIGDGTKIDNLVQIGHNCKIGRCVIICGHAGIAGSVTINDGAQIAGSAGVSDGVTIGAGARVTGMAGAASNIPAGSTVSGMPAVPHGEFMRQASILRRLARQIRATERNKARTGDRRDSQPGADT